MARRFKEPLPLTEAVFYMALKKEIYMARSLETKQTASVSVGEALRNDLPSAYEQFLNAQELCRYLGAEAMSTEIAPQQSIDHVIAAA